MCHTGHMPRLNKLRQVREASFLSQNELAAKADVNRHTISRLESGQDEAHPRTARKLAAALDVEPAELVGPPLAVPA